MGVAWAGIAADRSTTAFNTCFPRATFRRWPSFGGSYPKGQMDNSFFTFCAGGVSWLVVTLRYDPSADEVAWADRVVRHHPRHQVILVTHGYQRGSKVPGTVPEAGVRSFLHSLDAGPDVSVPHRPGTSVGSVE